MQQQGGFGLVELMVSISIMVIVASIILVRQETFNSSVLLRSQAYEVAFDLRDTQLSAVSATGDIILGEFRSILGIHLNTGEGSDGEYIYFRDSDTDGYYDSGEQFGLPGRLDPRFEIHELRLGGTEVSEVSVTFERPNFDARFFTSSGVQSSEVTLEIDIVRRGDEAATPENIRTVEVTASGQISVK